MKTVGQLLKEARLNQKLSLENVAMILKIRKSFIEDLENDRYERLPAEVYIKGVIKRYANFLNLNEQRALALFRREYSRQEVAPSVPPQPLKSNSFPITTNVIIGSVISLLILLFLTFLYWQYRNYAGKPLLVITSPTDQATLYQDYVEVIGKTDPEVRIFINGQEAQVEEDYSFAVVIGLNPGINHLTITARSKVGKETIVERQVEVINSHP